MLKFCKFCQVEHELSSENWYRLDSYPICRIYKLQSNRRWSEDNREKHRELVNRHYWRSRSKRIAQQVEYNKKREHSDVEFRLANRLRSRIRIAMKGDVKSGSAVTDLGCSLPGFRRYIEGQFTSEMNWDNYGSVWELDHILPLSNYQLRDRGTFRRLSHYTNLQPLFKSENRAKSNKEL